MKFYCACLLLVWAQVGAAFAVHDIPKEKAVKAAKAAGGGGGKGQVVVAQARGAQVKLDLSRNRCVDRSDEEYKNTLFYEEFNSLSECRAALERS